MAGKIVVNQVQLGDSGTATNNFVWQTNADGTAKLARGNTGATSQDILTVDAAGKVSLAAGNNELGVGQTWQDMTGLGGRAVAATITNSSGKPIMVSISGTLSATNASAALTIGSVVVDRAQAYTALASFGLSGIVPNGATYSITQAAGTANITTWAELR